MILVDDRCFRCNDCIQVCPEPGTITKVMPGKVRINVHTCIDCRQCIPACPAGALSAQDTPKKEPKPANPLDVYMDTVTVAPIIPGTPSGGKKGRRK